jgi:hypothetical protein
VHREIDAKPRVELIFERFRRHARFAQTLRGDGAIERGIGARERVQLLAQPCQSGGSHVAHALLVRQTFLQVEETHERRMRIDLQHPASLGGQKIEIVRVTKSAALQFRRELGRSVAPERAAVRRMRSRPVLAKDVRKRAFTFTHPAFIRHDQRAVDGHNHRVGRRTRLDPIGTCRERLRAALELQEHRVVRGAARNGEAARIALAPREVDAHECVIDHLAA